MGLWVAGYTCLMVCSQAGSICDTICWLQAACPMPSTWQKSDMGSACASPQTSLQRSYGMVHQV